MLTPEFPGNPLLSVNRDVLLPHSMPSWREHL